MAWVRLDDHFPDHYKLAELGDVAPLAGWLYVCGLAYCNRQLTDGRIPRIHVHRLATFRHISTGGGTAGGTGGGTTDIRTESLAGDLVRVGLWHEDGDYYLVHDYHHYQPSRDTVLKERARNLARKPKRRGGTGGGTAGGTGGTKPVPGPEYRLGTNGPVPVPLVRTRGETAPPAPGLDLDAYWQTWRQTAEAHGHRPYLAPRGTEAHHLATVAGHCSVADWHTALQAWWASPHVTSRTLGLAVSQLPELLAYVNGDAGSQDVPFRAPPDRPAKPARHSSPPATSGYDPDWRRGCTHAPPCTHPAQCARRAEIDAVKAQARAVP